MCSPAIRPGEHQAENGLNLNASGRFPLHLPCVVWHSADIDLVLWVLRGGPLWQTCSVPTSVPVPWAEGRLCCLAPGAMAFCSSLEGGVASRLAPGELGHTCCQVPSLKPQRSEFEPQGSPWVSAEQAASVWTLGPFSCQVLPGSGVPRDILCVWSGDLNCDPICSTSNQIHTFSVSLRTRPEGWGLLCSPTGGRLVNKGGLEQRSPVSPGEGQGAGSASRCGSGAQSAHGAGNGRRPG